MLVPTCENDEILLVMENLTKRLLLVEFKLLLTCFVLAIETVRLYLIWWNASLQNNLDTVGVQRRMSLKMVSQLEDTFPLRDGGSKMCAKMAWVPWLPQTTRRERTNRRARCVFAPIASREVRISRKYYYRAISKYRNMKYIEIYTLECISALNSWLLRHNQSG